MLPGLVAGPYDARRGAHRPAAARAARRGALAARHRRRGSTSMTGARIGPGARDLRPALARHRLDPGHRMPARRTRDRREAGRSASSRVGATIPDTRRPGALPIAVVGGGAGGIEILLAMHHRLAVGSARRCRVSLVTDLPHLLPRHAPTVRRRVSRILVARDVTFTSTRARSPSNPARDRRRRTPHRCGPDRLATTAAAAAWVGDPDSRATPPDSCDRRIPALAVAPVRVRRR